MKEVVIYTDGACSSNPGQGGWGAILIYKGIEKEISGFEEETTNNRMEMMAVIEALKTLTQPCRVLLYSDSSYIINAFNQHWIENWTKNGWRTASKEEVKNKELWLELIKLNKLHQIEWIKVKGHSDNEYNNRVDKIAVEAINKLKQV